jgi:hypothetical protein
LDAQGVASVVPLKEKKNGPAFLAFFTGADSSRNSAKPLPALREAIPLSKASSKSSSNRFSVTRGRTLPKIMTPQAPAQKLSAFPKKTQQEIPSNTKVENPEERPGILLSLRAQILMGQMTAWVMKTSHEFRAIFSKPASSKKIVKQVSVSRPEPVFKKNPFKISSSKAREIHQWVALEEKIIHDYAEQKTTSLQIPAETLEWVALEEKIIHDYAEQKIAPLETPVETREWVALEEKIIHFYAEEKVDIPEEPILLPRGTEKQSLPAFETFSTQTTASPAFKIPEKKEPSRKSRINLINPWILGVIAAGLVVGFVTLQGILSQRALTGKIETLQGEKKQIEQSYAEVQRAMENQLAEVAWLNSQVRNTAAELTAAQEQRDAYKRDLARIVSRYESQINSLREDLASKDSIIAALKAQIQVLGEVFDQASGVFVPGAASQFLLTSSGSRASSERGRVSKIEAQKGFFVVDRGANQGVKFGDSVTVSRGGIGLTVGRVDRVYSTSSSVIVPSRNILSSIREGDTVSFI